MELKKYEEVIEYYKCLIKSEPRNKELYYKMGKLKYRIAYYNKNLTKYYEEAIKDFSNALELDRDYKLAYYNKAKSNFQLKNYKKAIEDFSNALELDRDYKLAYYNKAKSNFQLKNYKESIKDFSKVLELDPKYKLAYYNRAASNFQLKNYNESIEDISKVLELDSNYKLAYYNRAASNFQLKNYKEAIEDFSKVLELDPKYKLAYYNKARLNFQLKNYKEAIEDFSKVLELDPRYKLAYYNKARSNFQLKNYKEAIEDFSKVLELDADYKLAYYSRGSSKYQLKNYEEAIEDYTKAIELDSKHKLAYHERGLAKYQLKNYEEAIEDYTKAIELDSNFSEAYNNRGVSYERLNNIKNAIKDYTEALKIIPDEVLYYKNKIISLEKLDKKISLNKNIIDCYIGLMRISEKKDVVKRLKSYILGFFMGELEKKYIEKIIKKIIDKKLYLLIEILEVLFQNKEKIEELYPNCIVNLKEHFKNNISKQEFEKDEFKDDGEDKVYYMYKDINKFTIEALVNKGVYKNKVENFNDPFDPYFKKYDTLLKNELEKIRITCFSETCDNLLLWAHYGKNHRGICLGYEISEEKIKRNKKISFKKVIYSGLETDMESNEEEIEVEGENIEINDISIKKKKFRLKNIQNISEVYLKKHKDWSYENEYRLIHLEIDSCENYFKNLKLKEVIFGIDTLDSDIDLIKKILGRQSSIKFFKMTQDKNLTLEKKSI